MKIYLDDDDKYRKTPEGFERVHDLPELVGLLESRPDEPIEVMDFDNDLGDETPEGRYIIKWLYDNHRDRWPHEIRVHTDNPEAAIDIRTFAENVRKRGLSKENETPSEFDEMYEERARRWI